MLETGRPVAEIASDLVVRRGSLELAIDGIDEVLVMMLAGADSSVRFAGDTGVAHRLREQLAIATQ